MIKNEWILFILFFTLIVLPNSFWFISKLLEQRTVNFKLLEFKNVFYLPQETKAAQRSQTKHILLYTSWFTQEDWYFGLGSRPFKGCPQSNCVIRNRGKAERAHAVLFHARNFKIKVGLMEQRLMLKEAGSSAEEEGPGVRDGQQGVPGV